VFGKRALAVSLFLATISLVACDDDNGNSRIEEPTRSETESPTSEPTEPPAGTPTTEPAEGDDEPGPPQGVDLRWPDILGDVPSDGFVVEVGEGAGTFLSVSDDAGQVLGYVEIVGYPTDTFTIFTSTDKSENYQALVADYYQVFESDRQSIYGAGYEFQAEEPEEVPVGELTGIRYGFTGFLDGDVVERYRNYAVIQGDFLYIMVAHYDQADPEQSWTSAEDLEAFLPLFEELVANLRFPAT
jgi:hypothetical protein